MEVKDITLRFGGVTAIEDVSFDILEGEVRASLILPRRWSPIRARRLVQLRSKATSVRAAGRVGIRK